MWLTNTQVLGLGKAFDNNSSAKIELSKAQLYKIGESGRFLGTLLWPSLNSELRLIGKVIKQLTKNILIPLGLTTAASKQIQLLIGKC